MSTIRHVLVISEILDLGKQTLVRAHGELLVVHKVVGALTS